MAFRKLRFTSIDPSQMVEPQPYGSLSADQMRRVVQLQEDCREFYDRDLDSWVDMFLGDLHREKELRLWEGIARAFNNLKARYRLSPSRRKLLGEMLVALSAGAPYSLDFVCKHVVEKALSQAIERTQFRADGVIAAKGLVGVNALRTGAAHLAFESEEVMTAFLALCDRQPSWLMPDFEPAGDAFFVCIAIHEPFGYSGENPIVKECSNGHPEFIPVTIAV